MKQLIKKALLPVVFTLPNLSHALEDETLLSLTLDELLDLEVTTSSRTKQSLADSPGTMVVVTRQDIERRGYQSLRDVMLDLPSFEHRRGDVIAFNQITVRGIADSNRILLLQDGKRIGTSAGQSFPIDDNYPLYHIKQIEVLYGPSSSVYGPDAFSVVINLIPFSKEEDTGHVQVLKGNFDSKYGSAYGQIDLTGNTSLKLGAHFKKIDFSHLANKFSEYYQSTDLVTFGGELFKSAEERSRPNFPVISRSYFAQLWLGDNWSVTFNQSDIVHSSGYGDSVEAVDYAADPRYYHQNSSLYVNYDVEIDDNFSQNFSVGILRYEADPRSRFNNLFSGFNTGFKYSIGELTQLDHIFDWRFSDKHKMIAGYNYQKLDAVPKTIDLPTRFNTKKPPTAQDIFYINTNEQLHALLFDLTYHNRGLFTEFHSDWNEKLSSVIGGRYDDNSGYGSSFNPRISLLYRVNDTITAKILYGEAFLAPSPSLSYQHVGSFEFQRDDGLFQSFFMFIPNPDLKPEQVKTWDLNISWRATENTSVTASFYHNQISDIIESAPTPEVVSDFIPGGVIASTFHSINAGKSDSFGADIQWKHLANLGSYDIEYFGNYSFLDGDFTNSGVEQELIFATKNKLKMGITINAEKWHVTASYHWNDRATARQSFSFSDANTAPPYSLVNLAGYYQYSDNVRFHMKVENLFNNEIFIPANSAAFETLLPQLTRAGQLGVSFSF